MQEAYLLIWKCDLIHMIVEQLCNDFTNVHGQWYTAVSLARVLTIVCSGLSPKMDLAKEASTNDSNLLTTYSKEEVDEYYTMVLPTATDSLLILANSIHDYEHSSNSSSTAAGAYLDQFEAVTDALIRLCSTHVSYTQRVIQSSYLLHLLVTDDHAYSLSVLTSVQELIKLDEQVINRLNTDVIQSILDELVYIIGGNDEILAVASLKVLALLSSSSVSVFDLICERYKGVSVLLQRWTKTSMDSNMLKFVSTLLERVKASDEEHKLFKAALVIQSGWRGYVTRRKLKKMKKGIVQLQRLFRKRKAERETKMLNKSQGSGSDKEVIEILTARKQSEQQIALLVELSGTNFSKYLMEQKQQAAIKIQSWWRGEREHKRITEIRNGRKLEANALVIQRAFRKHITKKQNNSLLQSSLQSTTVPALADHKVKDQSSDPLEWFYTSRIKQREMDRRRELLNTQVIYRIIKYVVSFYIVILSMSTVIEHAFTCL